MREMAYYFESYYICVYQHGRLVAVADQVLPCHLSLLPFVVVVLVPDH